MEERKTLNKTFLERYGNLQNELNAPKNQFNKFGGYHYRSCEDIFTALKPLLKKYNLSLQVSDLLLQIGERYYVKATATLYDNETGQFIENSAYAREEETKKGQDGSQITGASSSYARKYALNGLFLIDDVRDSDVTNHHDKTYKNLEIENDNYISFIDNYLYQYPEYEAGFMKKYKLKKLEDIKSLSLTKIDEILTGMKNEMAKKQKTGVYAEEETF